MTILAALIQGAPLLLVRSFLVLACHLDRGRRALIISFDDSIELRALIHGPRVVDRLKLCQVAPKGEIFRRGAVSRSASINLPFAVSELRANRNVTTP